jgi:sugar-specific transcriptional regulator TrmB
MTERLRDLGLSGSEIAVYIALLRLGSANAGKIAEHSGIHRRNVYDALERLSRKGLVGFSESNGVRSFCAASPLNLVQMLEEQKEGIRAKEEAMHSIVADLLSIHRSRERPVIMVYKGARGVKTVLEDILEEGKENLVLGAHKPPGIIANYLNNFHARRIRAGIRDRLIFNNDFERAAELALAPLTEVRLMPDRHDKTTCVNIYGDKVAILAWSGPLSIVIRDRDIAGNFRHYFNVLWASLDGVAPHHRTEIKRKE